MNIQSNLKISLNKEIKSKNNINYIKYISKQYCENGEYDPISNYSYLDDNEDDDYDDMLIFPWGNGQNGEQWNTDI